MSNAESRLRENRVVFQVASFYVSLLFSFMMELNCGSDKKDAFND